VLAEETEEESILLYQLFDNRVFFFTARAVERVPPVKIDGKYHITDKL
jgi:hypothetical protein